MIPLRRSFVMPTLLGAALLLAAGLPHDRLELVEAAPKPAPASAPPSAVLAVRHVTLPAPPTMGSSAQTTEPDLQRETSPSVVPSPADAGRGLMLLERIDEGDGPAIEIAWPADPEERRNLLLQLERCAGWRVLMLSGGRLWRLEDAPGNPWSPEPETAPSGLLRDLTGDIRAGTSAAAILTRHGLPDGRAVAVVDRRWDARLLGGLDQLLGEAWPTKGSLRARYELAGDRLTVGGVIADDRAVPGRVDLGRLRRCGH